MLRVNIVVGLGEGKEKREDSMFFSTVDLKTIDYICENLSDSSTEELEIIYGEDYKQYLKAELINCVMYEDITALCLDDNTPVAIFGLMNYDDDSKNLFFVSTKAINEVSPLYLIKQSIKQIKLWMFKYKKNLLDQVYRKNTQVIKWLKLLGFEKIDDIGEFFLMRKEYNVQ